ncbi:MAG: FtsX-like permease family protein [Pseudomonadota bacterium]
MSLSWRIARAELRGGLKGFRIFLACLALGVAAIAAVGTLRAAIETGLGEQGGVILGGDAQLEFTYRTATPEELAWVRERATKISQIIDFRSMVVVGEETGLTQVKAVDDAYPLTGAVVLDPALPLAEALATRDGLPGAVMDRVLVDRLALKPGDTFRLGEQTFRLSAALLREPDSATGGLTLGPRTIVLTTALAKSGLLAPGTLYESAIRMTLPPGTDLEALKTATEARFDGAGIRWSDRRRAAPGIDNFVERIAAFLVLVGLAGLTVGGVGVSSAVSAYLAGKTATIATLKTLGATGGLIFCIYLIQIGLLAILGLLIGLVLGIGIPIALSPLIEAQLPFPADIAFSARAALEAVFYGILTALLFTLWPLARSEKVRAAALYRGGAGGFGWPRRRYLVALVLLAVLLIGGAVIFSGTMWLALSTAGGIAGAMVVLGAAALGMRRLTRRVARSGIARGHVAWRSAIAAIGGPRAEAMSVILSLGLGLTVLAAIGQIDSNLRSSIARDLPARAPAFFFIDIQNTQIDDFRARMAANPAVTKVDSAPMLRGVVTRINGRNALDVTDHWVVRGDRGLTYSATPPEGTKITEGKWWPADYAGPPQISFAAEEAAEIGLKLDDMITVNVLGRDIEARITSFREVNFSTAGIGFVMSMSPNALQGAPHTFIATVYAPPEAEAGLLREITKAMPNVTAIRIRDAIDRVTEALTAIATATAWAAAATLITGFVVLIGAAAAGERARIYEAAVLKTLGATRATILGSFALRAALMGAAAGVVAIIAGAIGGWAVMTFVMDAAYRFEPVSAFAIVIGGILATLLAGLAFAWRPLAARPAQVLRSQE